MRNPADTLLARLPGARPAGAGKWVARCPAHEDKSPSLSIRDAGDRVLLKCHAGCSAAAVVAALGLTLADLFAEELDPGTRREMARQHSRRDLLSAIRFELEVLLISVGDRLRDPGHPPPEPAAQRETLAVQRLLRMLRDAYGVEVSHG